MIGTALGRYRLLEPLGEGGMGRVFLAEDPALGRRVAIKVLPPEVAGDPARRERLLHEARAASALNHPNIVTVHDVGDENGVLFVAMERIEGVTVKAWAESKGRTPREVLALARQAARALGIAHAAGLVHRDLKPENLMVREDGLLKILDFGLARSVGRDEGETAARTMPGTVLGTAPYMSPEQVLGQPAGPASDVFSLGTLLYELLTGRHPFAAGSGVDTMHRILHETQAKPSSLAPALVGPIDFVLGKALAKDPSRRYANGRELDVDLESCEAAFATPASGRNASGARTIAVLPFKNIGGNADLDYLGLGLADAVITRLASSPDLVVRATSSVARYDKQPVDPALAARELDVSVILDASFQRAGERLRATARLVDAAGGQALWAGKVDVRFEDIFEVQDEVATGIASALTTRLAPTRFVPQPADYDAFLRSIAHVRSGRLEDFHASLKILEDLVAREPGYADAWIRLGHVRQSIIDTGYETAGGWFELAEEAYRRGLAIEPGHPAGHYALGRIAIVRGRKREAYRDFAAAFQTMPNHGGLLHYIAYLFRLSNLFDRFFEAEAAAMAIDPTSPWPHLAVRRVYGVLGDIDKSRHWMELIQSRFTEPAIVVPALASQLRSEGRLEESLAVLDRARESIPSSWGRNERIATYLALGRPEEARPLIAELEKAASADMDFALRHAGFLAQLGETDRAFQFLDRAVELGNDSLDFYEALPDLAPLRSDPRWARLIEPMRVRIEGFRKEFLWPPA
jgi:serine/threonine protein kinase/tetratricopeptide (TPR) repeat protein